ncbi:MAG TPA: DUF4058 family protein [Armatimonadota bacterium]|nr:DUF4058 family protein [Armatimonadota bacterium]
MPSPFPGMDPYIEGQLWESFHITYVPAVSRALNSLLGPDYVALAGERVYVEYNQPLRPRSISPDTIVVPSLKARPNAAGGFTTLVDPPVQLTLASGDTVREPYVEIRTVGGRELITAIELLSPANKRRSSAGHAEYLKKRNEILDSRSHLIEIDLLRGGERPPLYDPYPPCDYCVLVSRATLQPIVDAWPFTIQDRLPTIPVPLAGGDPDVLLDLQELFEDIYNSGRYALILDYSADIAPPVSGDVAAWIRSCLEACK